MDTFTTEDEAVFSKTAGLKKLFTPGSCLFSILGQDKI